MIKQAIIPLAGLGTRMLPLTSVMPKELLPINGKTNLEYIFEECLQAGIKEFIFIISKNKLSIKKYFFNDNFYKKIIKKKKDKRLIQEFKKIKKYQKMIKFVYQNNPKGTGDAVLKCKKLIKNNYFLMLLPDDLIIKNNCSKEMIKLRKKTKGSVIATKKVDKKTVSRWGILSIKNKKNRYFEIKDVVLVQRPMLMKELHVKCLVFSEGVIKPVVFFNRPELFEFFLEHGDNKFDIAAQVMHNYWNGKFSIELQGVDVAVRKE